VCWCKVGLSNLSGILVSLKRLVGRLLSLVANCELSEVSVVITLPVVILSVSYNNDFKGLNKHLVVKDLGLPALSRRDKVFVKHLEDILADLGKLGLNLLTVLLNETNLG
jgi:hypothetical protein